MFGASTLIPQHLPEYSDHSLLSRSGWDENDQSKHRLHVSLYWPHDDSFFSYYNYMSLESLLAVYPHGTFNCFLLADDEVKWKKLPGQLAVNKFEKYRKLGHDIHVTPFVLNNRHYYKMHDIDPESIRYVTTWIHGCCQGHCQQSNCTASQRRPFHVSAYLLLLSLWRTGGLATDFTFFFLADLMDVPDEQGHYFNSYCLSSLQDDQRSRIYRPRSFDAWHPLECTTSLLLYFKQRRSPIISCVLEKYHNDGVFLVCLESDSHFQGSHCIRKAMEECFEKHHAVNIFDGGPSDDGSSSSNDGQKKLFVEAFHHDPSEAQSSLLATNWTLLSSSRLLWLGQLGWKMKAAEIPFPPSLPATLLHSAIQRSRELRQLKGTFLAHSPSHNDSLLLYDYKDNRTFSEVGQCWASKRTLSLTHSVGLTFPTATIGQPSPSETFINANGVMQGLSCSPKIYLIASASSGEEWIAEALQKHSMVLSPICGDYRRSRTLSSKDSIANRVNCYPFVEPGEKFETFDLLSCGSHFRDDLRKALILHEDNPAARAVFIIRHPIIRLYLNYASRLKEFEPYGMSLDEIVFSVLSDFHHPLSQLRRVAAQHPCDLSRLFDAAFNISLSWRQSSALPFNITGGSSHLEGGDLYNNRTMNGSFWRLSTDLVFASLHFLPVYLYAELLGRNSIFLLEIDPWLSSDTRLRREMLTSLLTFLNLTQERLPLDPEELLLHERRLLEAVPDNFRLSEEMFERLQVFFSPFSALLSNLTDLARGVNASTVDSLTIDCIFLSNRSTIASLPRMWFEREGEVNSLHGWNARFFPMR
eukprot:scaffold988_cov165-Ochromonas_danica.AAC.73